MNDVVGGHCHQRFFFTSVFLRLIDNGEREHERVQVSGDGLRLLVAGDDAVDGHLHQHPFASHFDENLVLQTNRLRHRGDRIGSRGDVLKLTSLI